RLRAEWRRRPLFQPVLPGYRSRPACRRGPAASGPDVRLVQVAPRNAHATAVVLCPGALHRGEPPAALAGAARVSKRGEGGAARRVQDAAAPFAAGGEARLALTQRG